MSKLNSACFGVRSVKSVLSKETLRMIYFSYIYSIIIYGIIFRAIQHPALKYSKLKKIVRLITNSRSKDSCRTLFKKMTILSSCSEYIHTLSLYGE